MPLLDPQAPRRQRFIWLIVLLPGVHAIAGLGTDCLALAKTAPSLRAVDGLSALDESARTVKSSLPRNALVRYDPVPGDDETLTHYQLQYVFAPTFVRKMGDADYVICRKRPGGYERVASLANGLTVFRRP